MPAKPARPPYQLTIGQWIVNAEARRDAKGRISVYKLPKGDGGGTFEVAGINDRYHPANARELRKLIESGQHAQAEKRAAEIILDYTQPVAEWTSWTCFEAFLRDCFFNRGPGGAAKILQIALGTVKVDGKVGPRTKQAMFAIPSESRRVFLQALRAARETYELQIAPPIGPRKKFWPGLVNRWNAAQKFADTFLAP